MLSETENNPAPQRTLDLPRLPTRHDDPTADSLWHHPSGGLPPITLYGLQHGAASMVCWPQERM